MLSLLPVLAAGSLATADIRPLLRDQGFDNPLNGLEEITYVGHIQQGRNDYQIYIYEGVFRAAVVDHGVQRIIVILNDSIYLGSYAIGATTECEVRGRRVVCDTDSPGRIIQFTRRGPPYQIWFDGEVQQMDFGDWFKNRPTAPR